MVMRRSQLVWRPALELLLEHWHRAPHCTGILGSVDRKQGADLSPASGVWQSQAVRVSRSLVALDFCVGNASPREPGRNSSRFSSTEVRMALEKRSRWKGWLGTVQDRREGNLTVPSTQARRALWWCSCIAHGEKAVTLWQKALSGTEWTQDFGSKPGSWLPGLFLCPKTSWFSWPVAIHEISSLQLHFDQFVIAVLDLSYTSISTQAQGYFVKPNYPQKNQYYPLWRFLKVIFSPPFIVVNGYNFKSTAGQEGLFLPWKVPVSLLGWAGRMDWCNILCQAPNHGTTRKCYSAAHPTLAQRLQQDAKPEFGLMSLRTVPLVQLLINMTLLGEISSFILWITKTIPKLDPHEGWALCQL